MSDRHILIVPVSKSPGVDEEQITLDSGVAPSFRHLMPPGWLRCGVSRTLLEWLITVNPAPTNVQKLSKTLRCPLWASTLRCLHPKTKCYFLFTLYGFPNCQMLYIPPIQMPLTLFVVSNAPVFLLRHNLPCWSACDHRVWLSQVQSHHQ